MTLPRNAQPAVDRLADQAEDLLDTHGEVAALVAALDMGVLFAVIDSADEIGTRSTVSLEAMIRAFLLKLIKGMQFIGDLPNYLRENPNDATALGFDADSIPKRTTFSRWWNDYFPDTLKAILTETATRIVERAHELGRPIDVRAFEAADKQDRSERTKQRVKRQKTREVAQEMRRLVYPQLQLERGENTTYSEDAFFDLLTHMGLSDDFAENGSLTFDESSDERDTPQGDTLLHHLKKFDRDEITALFDSASDATYEAARRMGLFDTPVNLAIDATVWRFYGDTETEMVTNADPARGTSYGYKFLSLCVVGDDGERFTLDVAPVETREDILEALEDLIETAKEHITIKNVLLDRGFYGVRMLNVLQDQDVNFIVRAIKSQKTTRLLDEADGDIVVETDDTMERSRAPYVRTTVNRFIVPSKLDDQEHVSFVTNREVTTGSATQLAELYTERWGIETSYRVAKDFMGKTASKDYAVRLFYFLFGVLLYNVWILVNAMVAESIGHPNADSDSETKSPPVTAKFFMTVLLGLREGIT